jgi:hypothetical protein
MPTEERVVKIRQLFAAAVSAGLAVTLTPAAASEPAKKPTFGFSTMKAATPEVAKEKAAAWLESVGKFDQAAFDKIWADDKRTVLDRTADSLALGNAEVATVFANLRKLDAPAPAEVPAVLKDEKQDPFFSTNVALAFARGAANKKAYEEALDAFKTARPEVAVDPASFYFFKAVSEHATMQKDAASASIVKLLDDVADAPDRYKMVATLMFFDMQNWATETDLANLVRLMDNSGRRLELARAGEKTQDIQKKIVFLLDKIINKDPGDGPSPPNPPPGPPGDDPGHHPKPGPNPGTDRPAPDSVMGGPSGTGKVDERQLRQIAEEWGALPPEKRAKIIADITRDLPAKYKPMIDEYFKALNRVHGFKK